MSTVLVVSTNSEFRALAKEKLSEQGHDVRAISPDEYQVKDETVECVVVDEFAGDLDFIYQAKWVGNTCVVAIYTSEDRHLQQLNAGAIFCIPSCTDVVDQLIDGPFKIQSAIVTSKMVANPFYSRFVELTLGFKNPREEDEPMARFNKAFDDANRPQGTGKTRTSRCF